MSTLPDAHMMVVWNGKEFRLDAAFIGTFNCDGKDVHALLFLDGVVKVFDPVPHGHPPEGYPRQTIATGLSVMKQFAFSADCRKFAAIDEENRINIWERSQGSRSWQQGIVNDHGNLWGRDLKWNGRSFEFQNAKGVTCVLARDQGQLHIPQWKVH